MSFLNRIIIVLFFVIGLNMLGQHKKPVDIDSLFTNLLSTKDSPEKVEALLDLNRKEAHYTRPDILEKALEVAEKIYYIDGVAKAFDQKGYVERKDNHFLKAIEYHKRGLGFFEKTRDTMAKIRCLNNLGVAFRKINNENEAYKYYIRALDLAKRINKPREIARVYNGIGNVFVNTEEYGKAMFYFKKALAIDKKSGNLRGQEYNIANIGEVFLFTKRFDSAEYYLKNALDLSIEIYKDYKPGVEYNLLGNLYKDKGDYIKSIYYYQLAMPILKEKNIKRYIANSQINMGLSMLYLGKKDLAYKNIVEGLGIAKEIGSKENISLGYDALVTYFEHINNYKKALEAHKLAKDYHDKVVNVTAKNGIISAQIIYETKEKDEKIKELAFEKEQEETRSRRNLIYVFVSIIVSLLIITFLFLFFNLRRRNRDLELSQKNAEIHNYLMRIKELETDAESSDENVEINIKSRLKELGLTKREIAVLILIEKGFNNDEIAEEMYISINTVKSHIKKIYYKLDVKNRAQALKKIRD